MIERLNNGRIILIHGDCLHEMRRIKPNSIDAIIADIPYGTTQCKWDTVIPFEPMWQALKRIIQPNGVIVLFGSQPFTSALVMSNPTWFINEWQWLKNKGVNFVEAWFAPMKEHENIIVFSANKHFTYNPQLKERTASGLARVQYDIASYHSSEFSDDTRIYHTRLADKRKPSSWIKFDVQRGFHPTQKPLLLMEYLVKTYTNDGNTILDFTMGSGTTGVACVNLNRRFIGIEKDENYFNIAVNRIKSTLNGLDNSI